MAPLFPCGRSRAVFPAAHRSLMAYDPFSRRYCPTNEQSLSDRRSPNPNVHLFDGSAMGRYTSRFP